MLRDQHKSRRDAGQQEQDRHGARSDQRPMPLDPAPSAHRERLAVARNRFVGQPVLEVTGQRQSGRVTVSPAAAPWLSGKSPPAASGIAAFTLRGRGMSPDWTLCRTVARLSSTIGGRLVSSA